MKNISPFTLVVSENCIINCSQAFYTWIRDNIASVAFEGIASQWGVVEFHITNNRE